MRKIIISIVVLICFVSCIENKTKTNSTDVNIIEKAIIYQDSISPINIFSLVDNWIDMKSSKIGAMIFYKDSTQAHTMSVLTDDWLSSNPFMINILSQFKYKYPYFVENKTVVTETELNLIDTVYKYVYKNSFVKFYKYDIISAKIKDSGIIIYDSIYIGLPKKEFFDIIFENSRYYDFSQVDTFRNSDTPGNIEQNYIFRNDTLQEIIMKSSYDWIPLDL